MTRESQHVLSCVSCSVVGTVWNGMADQGEGRKGASRSVQRVRAGSMQGPVPGVSKSAHSVGQMG